MSTKNLDISELLYNVSLTDNEAHVKEHILIRYLTAHRNGRKKDGSRIYMSKSEVSMMIRNISDFVDQIHDKIK